MSYFDSIRLNQWGKCFLIIFLRQPPLLCTCAYFVQTHRTTCHQNAFIVAFPRRRWTTLEALDSLAGKAFCTSLPRSLNFAAFCTTVHLFEPPLGVGLTYAVWCACGSFPIPLCRPPFTMHPLQHPLDPCFPRSAPLHIGTRVFAFFCQLRRIAHSLRDVVALSLHRCIGASLRHKA